MTNSGKVTNNYQSSIISEGSTLAAGPDGNLWFTNIATHSVGRMTPYGQFTLFKDMPVKDPAYLTAGPGGTMWFTNERAVAGIGRITTNRSA